MTHVKLSAILAPLVAANVSADVILQTVIAYEQQQADALEHRRRVDAERQTRKRERDKSRDVTLRHSDRSLTSGRDAGVEDKTSSSKIEPPKEEKRARGTRLPSNFALPPEWAEWAIRRGLPAHRVPIEFEKLTNWAANAQGSKGVKSDWFKAWQNWVLGAIDQLPPNRAPPPSKPRTVQDAIRDLNTEMELARANTPEEIQGSSATVVRLPAPQFGGR